MIKQTGLTLKFIRERLTKENFQQGDTNAVSSLTCAAVIVPIIITDNKYYVLFTKRTTKVRNHKNQISFPGGICETTDETPLHTAFREMEEEIGISITRENVLGGLPPRETTTGYYIHPFVAYLSDIKEINRNYMEVERVVCVPLRWLMNPKNYSLKPYKHEGVSEHNVFLYDRFEGEVIWGITASIILDLINLIKK